MSETALHEYEERMRLAVEGADFGIWVRDLGLDEIWATDKWRDLFGFSRLERLEIGQILRRLHPDDRDEFRSVLSKAALGDGSYEAEYRVVLPNGQMRWISFPWPLRVRRRWKTKARTWRLARYYKAKGSGAGDTECA